MHTSNDVATAPTISEFLRRWLVGSYLEGKDRTTFERYYASYANHFGPYLQLHYASQTRELLEVLGTRSKSSRVLEVGCGCGTESLWLALRGYDVEGIDVLEDLLSVGRARKQVLEQRLGSPLQCDFTRRSVLDLESNSYDVIWMEQAFHHLEPRAEVLLKLSAALRTGGALVISETNGWNPAIQAWLFRARGRRTVIEMNGAPWGNERILTAGSLSRLLSAHGIVRRAVRHFRFFPNKPWVDVLARRFGSFDDRDHLLLRPFYTHYNYVGVKA